MWVLAATFRARTDARDLVIGVVDVEVGHPAHANMAGRMVVLDEPEVPDFCPVGVDLSVPDPE